MAKNKKKRLVLDVEPEVFGMLKAMQRVLGLGSAEEVLLYSAKMVAKAFVSDYALKRVQETVFGAASRDADGHPPAQEDPVPPRIGTNLGDKIRGAIDDKE